MKKKIYTLAVLVFFIASCKKLDLQPVGSISEAEFYQTEQDALAANTACYNTLLRISSQGNFIVSGFELFGDIQSSDVQPHPDIVTYQQIQQYTLNATDPTIQVQWSMAYAGIYRANLALEKLPGISMNEPLKARLIGETHFIRAWWYFRLAKLFGGVPLTTKTLTIDELNIPKSTQQQIFNQVEADLLEAEKVLPVSYDNANLGRATLGAAKTYLAELYMWKKDWPKARKRLEDVINSGKYGLLNSYSSLFDGTADNSVESVFEIQYTANTGRNLGNFSTVLNAPNGEGFVNGGGWGWIRPTRDIVNEYETAPKEDPRLSFSIFRKGDVFQGKVFKDVVNGTGLAIRKWCITQAEGVFPWHTSCNFILYRYADVLLMYAEVLNEMNDPRAVDYINMVRARPSVAMPALSGSLNKAQIFEAIRHERRVEFTFEGKTGYDLRRWGIASVFLTSPQRWQNNVTINPQWGGNFFKYVAGKNEVLPIPQTEIDRSNGTLVQSKGF